MAALAVCVCVRSDSRAQVRAAGRMARLPRVTLWAWERREDLRGIDASRVAVAALDRTVTIGLTVESEGRRNPVLLPGGVTRIAVVRVEAGPRAVLNAANRDAAVGAFLMSAGEPGEAALQIDFDATRSQRAFYRSVLEQVRAQMPAEMPLSITALASWCSRDRWLGEVPIDEAVPMMFRMEPDRRRGPADAEDFRIREPLCAGAVGVSTTEPWPEEMAGRRVYVFSDNGWGSDSAEDVERRLR
ncbi:MAG TPA: DUF3142 domain-containing protein [Acidobacteriaceae bacterium]|nr:DUF3142 domain-containing protein [Acidobacteriaceae bacterium]